MDGVKTLKFKESFVPNSIGYQDFTGLHDLERVRVLAIGVKIRNTSYFIRPLSTHSLLFDRNYFIIKSKGVIYNCHRCLK